MATRRDDWTTPPKLFKWLDKRFNFNLDAAASQENHLCDVYLTAEDNTLEYGISNTERVFCNPPYSLAGQFAEHLYEQYEDTGTNSMLLLPVRCDRVWWNRLRKAPGVRVEFYTGRIHFGGSGKGAFMYNCNFIFGFDGTPTVDPIDAGAFNDNKRGSAKT